MTVITWQQLRDFKAQEYKDAAEGWAEVSSRARAAKDRVDSEMLAKLRDTQSGDTASDAISDLEQLSRNFQYIHTECGLIRTALNGFASELAGPQRKLKSALDEAQQLGFTVKPDGSVQYPASVPFAADTGGTAVPGAPIPFFPGKAEGGGNLNKGRAEDIAERIAAAVRDAVEVDGRYRSVLTKLKAARGLKVDDSVWADAGQDLKDVRKAAGGFLKESDIPKDKSPADNKKWWESLTQEQREEYTALYPASIGALDGVPSVVRDEANRVVLAEARGGMQLQLNSWLKKEPEHYQMRINPVTGLPMHGVLEPTRQWKDWNQKKEEIEGRLRGMKAIQNRFDSSDKEGVPKAYLLGFREDGNGRAIIANGNPDTADHTAVYVPGTGSNLAGIQGDISRMTDLWRAAVPMTGGQKVSTITWLGYDAPQDIVKDSPFSHYADDGAPAFNKFIDGLNASNGTEAGGHLTTIGHSYGTTLIGSAARQGDLNADDVVLAGSPGVQVGKATDLDVPKGHVWNEEADWDFVPDIGAFGHGGAQWKVGGGVFISPSDDVFGANQMSTDTTGHSDYWKWKFDPETGRTQPTESLRNQAAVVVSQYEEVQRAK
ncbi:alpha/beta hydrolase [Streptomyces sp. NPDC001339]|uniref:alpha/beta hydrolase n=1 Tax=Streptomyces sp. NPDC001339 TaxID=3364563 RepID=UPI0036CEA2A2